MEQTLRNFVLEQIKERIDERTALHSLEYIGKSGMFHYVKVSAESDNGPFVEVWEITRFSHVGYIISKILI